MSLEIKFNFLKQKIQLFKECTIMENYLTFQRVFCKLCIKTIVFLQPQGKKTN